MDHDAELRYYEILFQKTVLRFHEEYPMEKLTHLVDLMIHVADANTLKVRDALRRILTYDPLLNVYKQEYIVCLKLFTDLKDTEIRGIIHCSPNTIKKAMAAYESGDLYIHPQFDLMQSHEIRKIMKGFRNLSNIY